MQQKQQQRCSGTPPSDTEASSATTGCGQESAMNICPTRRRQKQHKIYFTLNNNRNWSGWKKISLKIIIFFLIPQRKTSRRLPSAAAVPRPPPSVSRRPPSVAAALRSPSAAAGGPTVSAGVADFLKCRLLCNSQDTWKRTSDENTLVMKTRQANALNTPSTERQQQRWRWWWWRWG